MKLGREHTIQLHHHPFKPGDWVLVRLTPSWWEYPGGLYALRRVSITGAAGTPVAVRKPSLYKPEAETYSFDNLLAEKPNSFDHSLMTTVGDIHPIQRDAFNLMEGLSKMRWGGESRWAGFHSAQKAINRTIGPGSTFVYNNQNPKGPTATE